MIIACIFSPTCAAKRCFAAPTCFARLAIALLLLTLTMLLQIQHKFRLGNHETSAVGVSVHHLVREGRLKGGDAIPGRQSIQALGRATAGDIQALDVGARGQCPWKRWPA